MLLIWCLCVGIIEAQKEPRVRTSQGWVVGREAIDGDYLVFYGIPYAGPTSGANRFKPPTPAHKYREDFQAVNNTIKCAQPNPGGSVLGVEDCLVLNIHTRNLTTTKPVFVWLEGEEYQTTTKQTYSYKTLVMEELVVVSINYRLSIFGFLCLRVPEAPGNAGLKDVIQGLKWIKDNIAGFGGDPNNIILVGHGSGGAMVDLITLSQMSKNLVHKAATLSGSALSPWAVSYEPIQYAEAFGAMIIPGLAGSELAKTLSLINIELLITVIASFEFYNASLLFAPCLENDKKPGTSFLTKPPIEILRSGNYNHIPYISGYTEKEGTIRIKEAMYDEWTTKMDKHFKDFLQSNMEFYCTENKEAIANNIRYQYFETERISMKNLDKYVNYHGDVLITVPIVNVSQERAMTSKADVRLFEFAYKGTINSDWKYYINSSLIPINWARHGDIPKFLFDYDLKPEDGDARNSMVDLFAGFAYTGKPFRSSNKSEAWLPIGGDTLTKLYISGGEVTGNTTTYSEQAIQENETSILFWQIVLDGYYKSPPAPSPSGASHFIGFRVKIIIFYVFVQIFGII